MIKPKACFKDTKKIFIQRKDKKFSSLVEKNKKEKEKYILPKKLIVL